MRYYIRPADKNEVQGPFAPEELKLKINQQAINSSWLATSDLGESLDSLRRSPPSDWFGIVEIPGIEEGGRNKMPERALHPAHYLLLALLISLLLLAMLFAWLRSMIAPS